MESQDTIMSNESELVQIETPVPLIQVNDAVQTIFHNFVDAAYQIPWYGGSEEEVYGACEDWNERILQAVMEHPVLVKVIDRNLLDWSLLFVACEKLHSERCHPAIKLLIEKNPSALLWRRRDRNFGGASPIHSIAGDVIHCRLMPWIAENYPWVLDHRVCRRNPPIFAFIKEYINQCCPAADIRRFFQVYPKALSQKNISGDMPLHAIVGGFSECDASLFKWMAEECPKPMERRSRMGISVLEHICFGLSEFAHYSDDCIEIIKYLIERCPKLVKKKGRTKALPIHSLLSKCNRRKAQDAVILLLKAYPESYDMHARFHKAPRTFPFVERVKPLIDKEIALKEVASTLSDVSKKLPKAVVCSSDSLVQGVANVVDSWSKDRLQVIEVELQGLLDQMDAIQKEFEGPDVESDEEDMDFDTDDDGQNSQWDDEGEESEGSFGDDSDESDEDSYGDY